MRERFNEYNPPISQELKEMYEAALAGELRWQGGLEISSREESVLDHVGSAFNIHDEVSYKYPSFFRQVNSDDVSPMLYIHDGGEIIAHDLPYSSPDYDILRAGRKRREAAAFRLLTREYVENPELRAYVRTLHQRFERQDPNDKSALYVRILDHVQAIRFGAVNVFNGRNMSRQMRIQKLNYIGHLFQIPSLKLQPLLNHEGRIELRSWIDDEIKNLGKNGYRADELRRERDQIHHLMKNAISNR